MNPSCRGEPCAGGCCCSAALADAGAKVAPSEVSLGMSMDCIRRRMSLDSFWIFPIMSLLRSETDCWYLVLAAAMFARCWCSDSSFDLSLPSLPLVVSKSFDFIPAFFKNSSTRSLNASPSVVIAAQISSWKSYSSSASSSWPSTLLVLGLSASSASFDSSTIPSFRSLSCSSSPRACIIMSCCSAPLV